MAEKESESEGETIETGWSVSTSRVLIQFYSENPLLWDKNHNNSIIKNKITRLLRKSAILFSGYQAYAVRLLSADPMIWSPGVYRTCQQSRGLVPSPVHTKG